MLTNYIVSSEQLDPGWCQMNTVPYEIVSMFLLFLKCFFLPALMPELVKIYKSGNSAANISKTVYFGPLL